jgi:hypothetical protein
MGKILEIFVMHVFRNGNFVLHVIENHMKMYEGVKVQLLVFVGILYKMEKGLCMYRHVHPSYCEELNCSGMLAKLSMGIIYKTFQTT